MVNDYNNDRNSLPPLERLQQRNRDVQRNGQQFILADNFGGDRGGAGGLYGGGGNAGWWANPAEQINWLDARLSNNWQEPQYFSPTFDYNLDLHSKLVKKPKKNWIPIYNDWINLNINAHPKEINSNNFYFKTYQSKKSIEYILLRAIANNETLSTKTTSYSPATGVVSLNRHPIACINGETYCVQWVCLPEALKTQTKLVRHRLRQLGIRCIKVDDVNRLYLTEDYWVPLFIGELKEISPIYNKVCLPQLWYSKNIFELPRQANLFASEWTTLPQFNGTILGYWYEISVSVSGNILHFKIMTTYGGDKREKFTQSYSVNNSEFKFSAIKSVIAKLKDELYQKLYEYFGKTKVADSYAYPYSQSGAGTVSIGGTYTTATNTILTTTTTGTTTTPWFHNNNRW